MIPDYYCWSSPRCWLRMLLCATQPPPQRAFAVVEVGPTQFKVAVDDMIVTERLRGADVNQTVALNRVLMLGTQDETRIGRPLVPDARVIAAVEVCVTSSRLWIPNIPYQVLACNDLKAPLNAADAHACTPVCFTHFVCNTDADQVLIMGAGAISRRQGADL